MGAVIIIGNIGDYMSCIYFQNFTCDTHRTLLCRAGQKIANCSPFICFPSLESSLAFVETVEGEDGLLCYGLLNLPSYVWLQLIGQNQCLNRRQSNRNVLFVVVTDKPTQIFT